VAAVDFAPASGHNGAVFRQRPWLLPLCLAIMVLGGWYFGFRALKNDRELPVYVAGGERLAAGAEIYRRSEQPGVPADQKPFTYPPFAALPFVPFARLPATWQAPAWFAVNFVILLLLLRWLHGWGRRDQPGDGSPRLLWYWILLLLAGAHHVLSVFANQSHDLFVAGAVGLCAAATCRGRATAGIWAGLGAAVKATPFLFLGLFVLRGRWLALLLLLLAFAGLSLLPDWLFPRADGRYWLQAWYELVLAGQQVGATAAAEGAWNSHSFLNQSLPGTLTRLCTATASTAAFVDPLMWNAGLSPAAFRIVSWSAQLAVLALIAWGVLAGAAALRRGGGEGALRRTLGLGEVASIACGMVLLSPQSSKAHFCVWLFPAAFLADRALRGRRDVLLWILLGLVLLLATTGAKDLVGTAIGNKLLAYGNVTWCTVLMLLGCVRAMATAGPRPDGPRAP